jgi:hypothetical protein
MSESPALIANANQARGTQTGNGARVGQPDVPPAGRPRARSSTEASSRRRREPPSAEVSTRLRRRQKM